MHMPMDVVIAEHAGACYGVERALKLAASTARETTGPVHTLGPLIHNPLVVDELTQAGVELAENLEDVASGALIVRTHGVVPQVIEDARERGLNVVDATCPYVKKVHHAAARLIQEGYQLIVVGEAGHPEVEGILGHAGGEAWVVGEPSDLDQIEVAKRVGVVVQTTQTADRLAAIVAALSTRVQELKVVNTICEATSERQRAAAELAERAGCIIVIGGKNSGNTRRLAEICRARCSNTHHIEDATEIDASWFVNVELCGITAGASTPQSHIQRALDRIEELGA